MSGTPNFVTVSLVALNHEHRVAVVPITLGFDNPVIQCRLSGRKFHWPPQPEQPWRQLLILSNGPPSPHMFMALHLIKLKDNSAFTVLKQQHRNVTLAKYIVWTKCVGCLIAKSGGTDSNHCALNSLLRTFYVPYPRVKDYVHYNIVWFFRY